MDSFAQYLAFEARWDSLPKKEVIVEDLPRHRRRYTVACECGSLQVILSLLLGPQGGVSEELTIVDTAQSVAADRLLLHDRTHVGYPQLLIDLPSLHYTIMKGEGAPHDLCLERMKYRLLWLLFDPKQTEEHLRSLKPHTETVGTLSAWRTAYARV